MVIKKLHNFGIYIYLHSVTYIISLVTFGVIWNYEWNPSHHKSGHHMSVLEIRLLLVPFVQRAEILLFVMLYISRIQVLSSRRGNPWYVTLVETSYTVLWIFLMSNSLHPETDLRYHWLELRHWFLFMILGNNNLNVFSFSFLYLSSWFSRALDS